MRPSTPAQRAYIYKLVGYDERTKEEAVQYVTGDNSRTSLKGLDHDEAERLIRELTGSPVSATPTVHPYGAFDAKNVQHRKILSLCQDYGWSAKHKVRGITVADIGRLGTWLQSDPRCPVAKPLKKMSPEELTKTINALTAMVRKKYR